MAGSRHDSDASIGSEGRKEAAAEGIEMILTRSLPPSDQNAPLVLNEANAIEYTGYRFSTKKKWWILTVVALCQTSMSKSLLQILHVTLVIDDTDSLQTTMRRSTRMP